MPPTRSIPPAKAVKTERTHEENQERAYIAASRRSDRSLEARVESARRASEIHKRRTGRSLRVTEQDVQNEEMYEEEDDDLPLQYRRLTAHLQTGSADFNRRLSAYLTNHVAMRSALEQSIHQSYAQQFPNAPQYGNQSMFPSPMLAHQAQQQQQLMQPPQSPSMYRQAPYPSPRQQQQQGFSLTPHQRSASIATPQESSNSSNSSNSNESSDNGRRMSMPTASGGYNPPNDIRSPTSSNSSQSKPSFPPGSFAQNQMQQNQFSLPSYDMGAFGNSAFPSFSTQLPGDAQGLLGSTLDSNDPLTAMMMAGSNNLPGNNYNFNNQQQLPQTISIGKQQIHPSFDGLNSTLAPSALEKQAPDADQTQDQDHNQEFFESAMIGKDGVTPGLSGDSWENWINDNSWDMPTASQ